MVFSEYQERNEFYTFKDVVLQWDKSYFILVIIKEFEAHEARNHWTLINKSEVNNIHKIENGNLKTILSIWYLKRKRSPYRKLSRNTKYRHM